MRVVATSVLALVVYMASPAAAERRCVMGVHSNTTFWVPPAWETSDLLDEDGVLFDTVKRGGDRPVRLGCRNPRESLMRADSRLPTCSAYVLFVFLHPAARASR